MKSISLLFLSVQWMSLLLSAGESPSAGMAGNRVLLLLGECGKGVWCLLSFQGMDSQCGCQEVMCAQRAPVTFGGWRTKTPSPAQALLGTCPLYLFGAGGFVWIGFCFAQGRGDFHLSCQAEEIGWSSGCPCQQCRLRISSLGCSHLLGRKETGPARLVGMIVVRVGMPCSGVVRCC